MARRCWRGMPSRRSAAGGRATGSARRCWHGRRSCPRRTTDHPVPAAAALPTALRRVGQALPAGLLHHAGTAGGDGADRADPGGVGSGPYRFLAAERVPGARLAYQRFEGYVPREEARRRHRGRQARASVERIEWQIIPDPATAAAALQTARSTGGKADAGPVAAAAPPAAGITVESADPTGDLAALRLNHLHPPFDDRRCGRRCCRRSPRKTTWRGRRAGPGDAAATGSGSSARHRRAASEAGSYRSSGRAPAELAARR